MAPGLVALVAGAWLTALVACASESVGPPPAPPVDWPSFRVAPVRDGGLDALTRREREVAERYAAALESPGFAALGPSLDNDVHFAFPGFGDAYGRGAVVQAHDTLLGAFEGRRVVTSRIFRTSDEQTVEWSLTGSQSREWMGVAATHKQVTVRGLTLLFTKDDGSITDVHLYFDVGAVKAQLGQGTKNRIGDLPPASIAASDRGAGPAPEVVETKGGAGPAPEVVETKGSAQEKANVAAARDALDALENGNLAAYESAFSDDVEVFTSDHAQRQGGKAEAGNYFKAMRRAIGELDTTITDAWGVGAFVIVEYTIAGEQRASLGRIPAQRDKAIRFHIVDVVAIQDGKIARLWRYENPSEALASPPE